MRFDYATGALLMVLAATPGCAEDAAGPPTIEAELAVNPLSAGSYSIDAEDEEVFTMNDDIFGTWFKSLELHADKTFKASVREMSFSEDGSFDSSLDGYDIEGTYSVSTRAPARVVFRYPVVVGGTARKASLRFYVKRAGGKVVFASDKRFFDAATFRMTR